jgi:hypothetical protein
LHFFSKILSKNQLFKKSSKELQKYYIGFCTLRPFKKQRVLEAYVPPLREHKSSEKKSFPLSLMTKNVQIKLTTKKNLNLTVKKAFPFMQQDGNYDCCAHVGLRTINLYLANKWCATLLSLENIVDIANSIPLAKRDAPTEGLSIDQIVTVLKKMGMDVLVYAFDQEHKEEKFPPERVVYHYIESGLPVLLGIPTRRSGHALVATGHTFDPDEWWPEAGVSYYQQRHSGGPYHCSTTWVCEFLVNDDNFGPYMTVSKDYLSVMSNVSKLVVVVPIPKGVNFKGEDAEVYSHALLRDDYFREALKRFPANSSSAKWAKIFWKEYDSQNVVLRTFLTESKKIIQSYKADDYPKDFMKLVKSIRMPDLVWITELSLPHLFSQHRKLLGRIIIDSTTTPLFGEPAYMIIRLPGQLIVRDKNDNHKRYLWENDYPRTHEFRGT